MELGTSECDRLDLLMSREWLETDGQGSYAAGTLSGINTRRYHGLLVASGGAGRRVLCAKVDETLFLQGRRHELGANQYPDTIHPQGYRFLTGFRLDPWPIWTYQVEGVTLEKHVLMLRHQAATLVVYRLLAATGPANLELRPMVAGRDYHGLACENWGFRRQADSYNQTLAMMPYDADSQMVFWHPRGSFQGDGFWYHSFVYAADAARGLDDREDLFNPGLIVYTLHEGEDAVLAVSSRPLPDFGAAIGQVLDQERERRAALAGGATGLRARLQVAADAFVVRLAGRPDVLAGYPWLESWRRDLLLAIPGLTVATDRLDQARELLAAAAQVVAEPAAEREDFGADVPLWFAWAARHYLAASGDQAFETTVIRPALDGYLARLRGGGHAGVEVAGDGLLAASRPGVPLTWMDAWLGDWVVTPRQGKPVEVNALWFALLQQLGEEQEAARVREAFLRRYWSGALGYLLDVIDGPEGDDATFRPNQMLAVAVAPDLLPGDVARRVTEAVRERLLTPVGLRTLDPADPRYRGQYAGDVRARDEAYHQGTVWPWLLGAYADAVLRLYPDGRDQAAALLVPFEQRLAEYGFGWVGQVFDGDAPHRPGGCPAHAVSVAEMLRIAAAVQP